MYFCLLCDYLLFYFKNIFGSIISYIKPQTKTLFFCVVGGGGGGGGGLLCDYLLFYFQNIFGSIISYIKPQTKTLFLFGGAYCVIIYYFIFKIFLGVSFHI